MRYLFALMLMATLSGCIYKMPDGKHIATSPNTGNPHLTREKPSHILPGLQS
jgi:hypothetical protein